MICYFIHATYLGFYCFKTIKQEKNNLVKQFLVELI